MEEKTFIVYKHTSPNGKVYVGITCHKPSVRWKKDGKGYKNNVHFWGAIQMYGWDNFTHEILYEGLSEQEACQKEAGSQKTSHPEEGNEAGADTGRTGAAGTGSHSGRQCKTPPSGSADSYGQPESDEKIRTG